MIAPVCRVCLDGDVSMYYINSEFRGIYENLANTTLNAGDGRPETVCYICFSHLRRCYRFSQLCKKSEQILKSLLDNGYEMTTQTIDMLNYSNGMKKKYSVNFLSSTVLPPPPIIQHNQEVHVKKEIIVLENFVKDDETDYAEAIDHIYSMICNEEKEILAKGKHMHYEEKQTPAEEKEKESDGREINIEEIYIKGHVVNTREKLYGCSMCIETFTNKKSLASHFSHTHKEFHCDMCLKIFTKRKSFITHWRNHQGRLHACTICEKAFYGQANLKRHMQIHNGDKPYACEICSKTFTQKVHVKNHMKVHAVKKRPYNYRDKNKPAQPYFNKIKYKFQRGEKPTCDICKKAFCDLGTLRRHIKLHTGERPYPCKLCDKAYIQSSSLKSHMKSHLKVKNTTNVCHICGKIFNKRRALNMHLRIHSPNRFCNICSKAFATLTSLKNHMYTHTREKPQTCNLCSKKFSLISTLRIHLRTHTGEKPYTCHDCGRTFGQKICLIKHTRVHSGVKPFACDKCDRKFTQKNSLIHHLKSRLHKIT